MCFERGNPKPTHGGQVREVGTRVRPPELLDRVAVGRTCAGWLGWAGCLDTSMLASYKMHTQKVLWFLYMTLFYI